MRVIIDNCVRQASDVSLQVRSLFPTASTLMHNANSSNTELKELNSCYRCVTKSIYIEKHIESEIFFF